MCQVLIEDVEEVRECLFRDLNPFLQHGYVLLAIEQATALRTRPVPNERGSVSFVQKSVIYVVGRRNGTLPYDPPPREAKVVAG